MRGGLTSLPVQATALLAMLVLAVVGLRARNSQDLLAAFESTPEPFEVVVHMPFEPEAFHLAELQAAGRIVSVDGQKVRIRAVETAELRGLSWQPWISGLEPLPHAN